MSLIKDDQQTKPQESAEGGLWRPELPRLTEPIMISLKPEDVISVARIVLDQDREEALEFVTNRLEKEIRTVTDRVR
jgi:hypothetical protein